MRRTHRDFAGGVWHGALLAAGRALADPVSVMPAFIHQLTGSSVWVGGLSALLAVTSLGPQVVVARFVEPRARKKPVLLWAVYIRALAWVAVGVLIALLGPSRPQALLTVLVGLLAVFSAAGALGGVPYVDVIGKVIPRTHRGRFFASREAAGSVLALGSSAVASRLLKLDYPNNYAALFVGSGALLLIASLGVIAIREPPGQPDTTPQPWGEWLRSLGEPVRRLGGITLNTWVSGASLLALPLYVVYARELGAPDAAIAWFIAAGVGGGLLANLLWARIVDRLGARSMIRVYVAVATLAPALALTARALGWPVLIGVLFVAGATQAGRKVGFNSALLEIASAERRATCGATYALLSLPAAVLPLLGGLLAHWSSYPTLFTITLGILLLGNISAWWWARPLRPRPPG